ncbi:ATP-binding protein, partial [TM7 phylum sp. oral taxon 346]
MKEIKRDTYLKELIDRRGIPLIKVITGVRRCGKSYLLNPIFKDYLISDGVPEDHIIYLNLELLENEKLHDRETLHAFILDQVKDSSEYFLLLDEIQLVNRFESVLSSFLAKG